MSKKRKTRKEKEALKKHSFSHVSNTTVVKKVTNEKGETTEIVETKESQIEDYVIKDFKKVVIVTGSMLGFTLVIWVIVYHTTLLDGVFRALNISY